MNHRGGCFTFVLALGAAAAFIYSMYSLGALMTGPKSEQVFNFVGMLAGAMVFSLLATIILLDRRSK